MGSRPFPVDAGILCTKVIGLSNWIDAGVPC